MKNIVWFRSDLRTLDNPALHAAITNTPNVEVRAVYYVTEQQWLAHNWGANKIGFVLHGVLDLQKELATLNIELDIEYCADFKVLPPQLLSYARKHQAKGLFFNQEYELNETLRDRNVIKIFSQNSITIQSYNSQTLIEPGIILTKQASPYNVFTPFKRACYEYLAGNPITITPALKRSPSKNSIQTSSIDNRYQHYLQNPILKSWQFGQKAALAALNQFCNDRIYNYQDDRDFPALDATSNLSAHLAVGSISAKQCFVAATASNQHEFSSGRAGVVCWISELIWRDFYRNIIFHYPRLCKGENFNRKYDRVAWLDPEPNLTKWQNGQTGVPIVDAAMRQLITTGWMHNRLRMIVAMFLTKNLLIDWRHGEEFFSKHLIDLDFASNNGGWQWSASTGTDAVPYFRIFNPITQGKKFDPNGAFVKKYCAESDQIPLIVDISKSRLRAIEHFKTL